MTKAAQIHERIEAAIASGTSKADAFRELADELGLTPKSVQGAFYAHNRKLTGGSTTRARKRETTTADAVAQAIEVLQRSLESIDAEISAAKERADEAKHEHDALKASATERKQAIQAKIDALNS